MTISFKLTKRRVIPVGIILALVIGVTAAWAAGWLIQGTGDADGRAAAMPTFSVTGVGASLTPDPSCLPGNLTACTLNAVVGGAQGEVVRAVAINPAAAISSDSAANCPNTNWSVNTTLYPNFSTFVNLAAPVTIGATGQVTIQIPSAVRLSATAPTTCSGMHFDTSTADFKVNGSTS